MTNDIDLDKIPEMTKKINQLMVIMIINNRQVINKDSNNISGILDNLKNSDSYDDSIPGLEDKNNKETEPNHSNNFSQEIPRMEVLKDVVPMSKEITGYTPKVILISK